MTRKQKKMTVRLAASAALLIAGVALEGRWEFAWIPFLLSYLAAGYDIPLKAARNISRGQVFDENFLMTVATFGAVAVGALEEAVAVMLFYQLGELFNDYAVGKSRQVQQLILIRHHLGHPIHNVLMHMDKVALLDLRIVHPVRHPSLLLLFIYERIFTYLY